MGGNNLQCTLTGIQNLKIIKFLYIIKVYWNMVTIKMLSLTLTVRVYGTQKYSIILSIPIL